jgi:hypothetical protein
MRRLVWVKGKELGFDFPFGGGLVFGFVWFAGSFITGLLSALECAGCGARCMLVSAADEGALLSEERPGRAEAELAVAGTRIGNELSKTAVSLSG